MYRPAQYAIDARTDLHGVIRAFPFAVIALGAAGRVELAYAPVVLDESSGKFGGIRFHLARANPITNLLTTCEVLASFRGPDAYISPDWYQSRSVVPTWNYVAVEGRGPARRLEDAELRVLLEDLSEQEEGKLSPKSPWTLNKISPERMDALVRAIVGFSVCFDSLEGKFKLSQEKSGADADGAVAGLEARADPASLAVASAMRRARR